MKTPKFDPIPYRRRSPQWPVAPTVLLEAEEAETQSPAGRLGYRRKTTKHTVDVSKVRLIA